MKKIRLSTHETGPDCGCKSLKCFQRLSKDNVKKLINDFNNLTSNNEQSLHLADLINVHQVKNRRPRKNEDKTKFHVNAFTYKVRIHEDELIKEIPICYNCDKFQAEIKLINTRLQEPRLGQKLKLSCERR